MVTFKYQAISRGGEKVSGVVEAFNETDAVERIKQSCDIVLNLKEVSKAAGFFNMEVGKPKLNAKAQ